MTDNRNSIEQLLPLYFEGKLDAEQLQQVDAWIDSSADNKAIARGLASAYDDMDNLYVLGHTDTEKALRRVHGRISKARVAVAIRYVEKVAAVLLLPVLLFAAMEFYQVHRRQNAPWLSVTTNPGVRSTVTLPDGSKVMLNSGSSLSYPSTFDGKRQVALNGEAYFSVAKDEKHAFIVKTPWRACIKVYGTKFNVEAYEGDQRLAATLVEGSVGLTYSDRIGNMKERLILPGEQITYLPQTCRVCVAQAEVDMVTAWKDGRLIFRNSSLQEVLKALHKTYGVDFVVSNRKVYQYRFTGMLEGQQLEQVLRILSMSSKMHFRTVPSKTLSKELPKMEVY